MGIMTGWKPAWHCGQCPAWRLHIPWDVSHFKGPLCLVHRDQGIHVLGGYKSRLTDPGHEEKWHVMGLCLGTSDSWCSTGKWLGKVDLLRTALTSKVIRRTTLPAFLPSSLIQQQSPQASLFPRTLPPDVTSHSSSSVSVS